MSIVPSQISSTRKMFYFLSDNYLQQPKATMSCAVWRQILYTYHNLAKTAPQKFRVRNKILFSNALSMSLLIKLCNVDQNCSILRPSGFDESVRKYMYFASLKSTLSLFPEMTVIHVQTSKQYMGAY